MRVLLSLKNRMKTKGLEVNIGKTKMMTANIVKEFGCVL